MPISLSAPRATELKPRIVVFGVGGAGGNAVNNMIEAALEGTEFVVANTDAQQLQYAKTDRRIQLGVEITQGLGAGARPEIGMSAAEESIPEIGEHLEGAHMVFITAGMGGGTGTGAAPIIARAARERGILTVGVVTKPFQFEGRHRLRLADAGVNELQKYVDTLIVIPNQNLFRIANERTTFAEAFGMADQVLHSGVRSITDLMVLPGLINLDFADVRSVMSQMGRAMMGTGEASGEDRALQAAQNAISNPLLDETSLKGAKAVLVNVTGGLDMTLLEVDEAANAISGEVDPEANIIFGAAFDPMLEGKIRVSVVATGMNSEAAAQIEPMAQAQQESRPQPQPQPQSPYASRAQLAAARAAAAVGRPNFPAPPRPTPVDHQPTLWPEPARPEPVRALETLAAAYDQSAPTPHDTVRIIEESPIQATAETSTEQRESYAGAQAESLDINLRGGYIAGPNNAPLRQRDQEKKGGFLSMFSGRPRYEAPVAAPQAPAPLQPAPRVAAHGGAAAAAQPTQQPQEAQEDLDIPSFLRRLAN